MTRWIAWDKPDGKVSKIHAAQYNNPFKTLCGHTSINAEIIEPGNMSIDDMMELFCKACIYLHYSGAAAYYRSGAKEKGKIDCLS